MATQKKENLYYTTLQYQEFEDPQGNSMRNQDDDRVFAKAVLSGLSNNIRERTPNQYRYYLRFDYKTLHDPFPLYTTSTNRQSFKDKLVSQKESYKEVPKDIFDQYLSYLRTENPMIYRQTKRSLTN